MEDINVRKNFNNFVIIGLGKFGRSLAINLSELGKKVLVVDNNVKNIEGIQGQVTNAVAADVTQKEVLRALGVQNFDCAIICIGDNLSASMLSTLVCKELKVPYVIAKAQSDQHRLLLEKVGADLILFPEVFVSKKLSLALTDPYVNELITLTENYKIVEMKCPNNWVGKTIIDVNMRKKFGVTIILIKRGEDVIEPTAESVFEKNDSLVVGGAPKNIDVVKNKTADMVDFTTVITGALSEE